MEIQALWSQNDETAEVLHCNAVKGHVGNAMPCHRTAHTGTTRYNQLGIDIRLDLYLSLQVVVHLQVQSVCCVPGAMVWAASHDMTAEKNIVY